MLYFVNSIYYVLGDKADLWKLGGKLAGVPPPPLESKSQVSHWPWIHYVTEDDLELTKIFTYLFCAYLLLPVCVYIYAFMPGILALDPLELWTVVNCCCGAETQPWGPLQRAEGVLNYWFILLALFLNSWSCLPVLLSAVFYHVGLCGTRSWMQGFNVC